MIVVAKRFLRGSVHMDQTVPYTVVRNWISSEIDRITIQLSEFIEDSLLSVDSTISQKTITAVPTGAIDPCSWNATIGKTTGFISLKNAACLAGLGVIGKNTLLLTPQYGNMVWLGAVITTAELEGDPMFPAEKNPCKPACAKCIENCPAHALESCRDSEHTPFIDQDAC